MTKAVSNREICCVKAVLLLCKHGHFFLNFKKKKCKMPPPPYTIRVKLFSFFSLREKCAEEFNLSLDATFLFFPRKLG